VAPRCEFSKLVKLLEQSRDFVIAFVNANYTGAALLIRHSKCQAGAAAPRADGAGLS
jgi:hypothetical protein